MGGLLLFSIVIYVLVLVGYIQTLLRLQAAFAMHGVEYKGNIAWLLLIPLLNIVIYFVLLSRLSEAAAKLNAETKNNAVQYGVAAGVLHLLGLLTGASDALSMLVGIIWLGMAIAHWVALHSLAQRLEGARTEDVLRPVQEPQPL